MEQNLAVFLPLDKSDNKNINAQDTARDATRFDFRTILNGIERHAQRIYAQPNGRADKLEQLANLLVGSATTLLASAGLNESDTTPDEQPIGENKIVYFPIQSQQVTSRDHHQLFLDWLFEQLNSSTSSIVAASTTKKEAVTQFSLFLEETASSLEEFANRYSSIAADCDWSL